MNLVDEKVMEIAKQHSLIIEKECQLTCEKYKCNPEDLILEYHTSMEIKIMIQASHFVITNQFTFDDKQILNAAHRRKDI